MAPHTLWSGVISIITGSVPVSLGVIDIDNDPLRPSTFPRWHIFPLTQAGPINGSHTMRHTMRQ